jgi:hypothetical protein
MSIQSRERRNDLSLLLVIVEEVLVVVEPMSVTVLGITTDVNCAQEINAYSGIAVTLVGIIIVDNPVPSKACPPSMY